MTALHDRFTITHPDSGLVATARSLFEAFTAADSHAARTTPDGRPAFSDPYAFEVYDRMARRGRPRCWGRRPRTAAYHTVRGDSATDAARWLVVGVRPESERTVAERRSGTT